jgi:hypothetical protein
MDKQALWTGAGNGIAIVLGWLLCLLIFGT